MLSKINLDTAEHKPCLFAHHNHVYHFNKLSNISAVRPLVVKSHGMGLLPSYVFAKHLLHTWTADYEK